MVPGRSPSQTRCTVRRLRCSSSKKVAKGLLMKNERAETPQKLHC